jgi:hypothetical protein
MSELPFIDEHSIRIPASRDHVWNALHRYVDSTLVAGAHSPLTWILGTQPHAGFEIEQEVPGEQLGLAGRHRFSVYRLVFELSEVADETQLSALTYAEFPRLRGRVYRTLVIRTGFHVLATKHILRSVRRSAVG